MRRSYTWQLQEASCGATTSTSPPATKIFQIRLGNLQNLSLRHIRVIFFRPHGTGPIEISTRRGSTLEMMKQFVLFRSESSSKRPRDLRNSFFLGSFFLDSFPDVHHDDTAFTIFHIQTVYPVYYYYFASIL